MTTHISAEHHRAFEALTSGRYENFCLFSCLANGQPAAAMLGRRKIPPGAFFASPGSDRLRHSCPIPGSSSSFLRAPHLHS